MPLSEIREGYVVDPIQDLIPVCSNCHTALHSKKDGVYKPEELRTVFFRKPSEGKGDFSLQKKRTLTSEQG